jgi:MFS family permease
LIKIFNICINELKILKKGFYMTANDKKGWLISLIGALFFFYAFFQANLMTSLNGALAKYFGASSADIGMVSAWFFYANVLLIIPAGLLLDRFSLKILMGINMLIAISGTIFFAFSESFFMIGFGRFLSGIMMAFGLIICLKLASLWLPSHKMALASSLIVTIGMLGAIVSQAPMIFLIDTMGWQGALLMGAILGLIIGIILWFVVIDPRRTKDKIVEVKSIPVLKSLLLVVKQPQNWFCGFYICLLNLPVAIFGALFGITYLVQVYNLAPIQASSVISMLFFGMIVGSPFFGWFSDFIRIRKLPMLIGSIICLIFILIVLYVHPINFFALHVLLFLIGFTSAAQVLGYPVISESNSTAISGTALSLASFIIMGGGYGLGLPFVGKLLHLAWDGKIVDGMHVYSLAAYHKAFLIIPIGIIISVVMLFFMKETKCQSIVDKK